MIDLRRHWWPLATLAELDAGRPLARTLLSVPLVLFRDVSGRPVALWDRCPHRHAPLSNGRLQAGVLECPYHGWRFDGTGRCTRVPGVERPPGTRPLVRSVTTRAAHGMVWGCLAPDALTPEPVPPAHTPAPTDAFLMTDSVRCSMIEAAENFLDGAHTHFVHAGWIRRDSQRQAVKVRVRALPGGVEAHYSGEGRQSGWISRLLEADRAESMGRFRLPGVAEIEYRSARGLNLLVTAWLTPEAEGCLRVHARIATPRGWLPAGLKRLVLRRLFGVILRQDKTILEKTHAHAARFTHDLAAEGAVGPLDGPLDFLGPSIRKLMNAQALPDFDAEALLVSL